MLMDGDPIPQCVIEKGKRAFHSFMDIELLVIRFIQTYKIGKTPDNRSQPFRGMVVAVGILLQKTQGSFNFTGFRSVFVNAPICRTESLPL